MQRFFCIALNGSWNIGIVCRERDLHLDLAVSILTDLTRPNETISRVKPGYLTDFSAFIACSSEIVMHKTYLAACRT
jgi:hypothetical protein